MRSKAVYLFDEGRRNLKRARLSLAKGQSAAAEKAAHVAMFQASQAYILKMTEEIDEGRDMAFSDLKCANGCVDIEQVMSVANGWLRERGAHDGGDAGSQIKADQATTAIENAIRFLSYIERLIQ